MHTKAEFREFERITLQSEIFRPYNWIKTRREADFIFLEGKVTFSFFSWRITHSMSFMIAALHMAHPTQPRYLFRDAFVNWTVVWPGQICLKVGMTKPCFYLSSFVKCTAAAWYCLDREEYASARVDITCGRHNSKLIKFHLLFSDYSKIITRPGDPTWKISFICSAIYELILLRGVQRSDAYKKMSVQSARFTVPEKVLSRNDARPPPSFLIISFCKCTEYLKTTKSEPT